MHTSSSSVVNPTALLKETALLNIDLLFNYWKIDYVKISDDEYDFISPMREDTNFGAMRFNARKGIGADFAAVDIDLSLFPGFDKSDFGFSKSDKATFGFDIIGLCQKIHGLPSYKEGEKRLKEHLAILKSSGSLQKASIMSALQREQNNAKRIAERIDYAKVIMKNCKHYVGTVAEKYFNSRKLNSVQETNVYFSNAVMCVTAKRPYPAIILPIQKSPEGEIRGVHRIYLSEDGSTKAPVDEPKMALGEVKTNAIWFGTPCDTLYLAEGPENALTLRVSGAPFVACAINASNMHMLRIPTYVQKVIVCPDPDDAGVSSAKKCMLAYKHKKLFIKFPKIKRLSNGKLADFNDILVGK